MAELGKAPKPQDSRQRWLRMLGRHDVLKATLTPKPCSSAKVTKLETPLAYHLQEPQTGVHPCCGEGGSSHILNLANIVRKRIFHNAWANNWGSFCGRPHQQSPTRVYTTAPDFWKLPYRNTGILVCILRQLRLRARLSEALATSSRGYVGPSPQDEQKQKPPWHQLRNQEAPSASKP